MAPRCDWLLEFQSVIVLNVLIYARPGLDQKLSIGGVTKLKVWECLVAICPGCRVPSSMNTDVVFGHVDTFHLRWRGSQGREEESEGEIDRELIIFIYI